MKTNTKLLKILKFLFLLEIILLLIPLFTNTKLWASPDIFQGYSHYFSLDKEKINTGLKADFSFASIRTAIDKKASENLNYNWGISLFSQNYLKTFPMEIAVGNLSIGGSLSKLANPLLDTTVSGFSTAYSGPTTLGATLPLASSFTKPLSIFSQFGYFQENNILENITLSGAYIFESNQGAISGKIKMNFLENLNSTYIFTFDIFQLQENIPPFWYSPVPYFQMDKNICFSSQFELNLYNFYTIFSIFSYETPFGNIENIFRWDNKYEGVYIKASLSTCFNHNENIITADNNKVPFCTQGKGNFQYETNFGPNDDYKFKLSTTGFLNIKEKFNNNFKFNVSALLDLKKTSVLADSTLNYNNISIKDGFQMKSFLYPESISIKLSNSWIFNYVSPSVYFISTVSFPVKQLSKNISSKDNKYPLQPVWNHKIKTEIKAFKDTINCFGEYSFSIKNNLAYNKKLKWGIKLNFCYKKVLILVNFDGEFCI